MRRTEALAICNLYAHYTGKSEVTMWRVACIQHRQKGGNIFSERDKERIASVVGIDIKEYEQTGAIPDYIVFFAGLINTEYTNSTGYKMVEDGGMAGKEKWKYFLEDVDEIIKKDLFDCEINKNNLRINSDAPV
ncbi:MAG TPA: hypothetical protein ENI66_00480 [Candidatus Yonathbacteria bacterium]|nr:hypothetical protein [Candidatus Yonathbacteria bacterium]